MKTIFDILNKRQPTSIWWLSIIVIAIIFCAIFIVKEFADLTPLLVIPVLLASWYGSSKTGIGLAMLIALSMLAMSADIDFIGFEYSSSAYDVAVILVVYIFVAILVTNFRKVHGIEVEAADSDTLTGLHSSRSFYAEIANEILRSNRYGHKFSLAYIDVDNFKKINDTFGHDTGDKLLIELSKSLVSSLRATDTIARIGGDEFVCLFPETEQGEAKSAILKAEKSLKERMNRRKWDVSFSIGLVTFESLPEDVREAVKIADELMYSVKKNKKNDIAYKVWHGNG
ncbi:GGDEF domain-containing protein [Vibrio albus]|uniref:diguanylate cyclase n=1 Tax=Vibrio albus TaxID=2200953 RepID=A0A2U3BEW5_9VIBR|nr:GGDEF domain-containing protein [Vibrio albus]PWI35310.1 GGDEF domain-containing protein [Vibrio albus]